MVGKHGKKRQQELKYPTFKMNEKLRWYPNGDQFVKWILILGSVNL